MTFLEALMVARPMRRTSSPSSKFNGPWLVLGAKQGLSGFRTPWLRIDTGEEVTLANYDYMADDWETMS